MMIHSTTVHIKDKKEHISYKQLKQKTIRNCLWSRRKRNLRFKYNSPVYRSPPPLRKNGKWSSVHRLNVTRKA